MEKLFTLKNSLKYVNDQEELAQLEENEFHPSDESIQFILNYSKVLRASKTKSLGDVFTVLN